MAKDRNPRLRGRTALVTGAGGGMGRAISLALGEEGATVVVVDVDETSAAETVDLVRDRDAIAWAIQCDVARSNDVARLGAELREAGHAIDVLCNNAGVFDDFVPATEMPDGVWDRVLAINLTGPFILSRALLPDMVARGSGTIINIASICSFVGGSGGVAYTASKHGLLGLTRELAHEYGQHGIRVNAVCPGVIETGMSTPLLADPSRNPEAFEMIARIPSRRLGEPDEVARLVAFLASDEAAFIQGAAIPIDGGWTAI